MKTNNSRQIFVNLPVQDLKRSMDFFGKLGFQFNPQFTDDKAASMIVNEHAPVMLLNKPFLKTFAKREICDTRSQTEGLFALSCSTRAEVGEMVDKALASGAEHAMEPHWTTASCTAAVSTTWMDITGRSCGWTPRGCLSTRQRVKAHRGEPLGLRHSFQPLN